MKETCYDPNIDQEIFEIIDSNNNNGIVTTFNKLVESLGRSSRTVSKHLDFLANDQRILLWTQGKPGYSGSIKFTIDAEKQRKYGLLKMDKMDYSNKRGICKEWKQKNKIDTAKERERKKVLFLLLSAAHGSIYYRPSDETPSGFSYFAEQDFSLSEIEEQKNNSNGGHFPMFNNIDFSMPFNKSETEKLLYDLEKDEYILFRKILGQDGNVRYDIQDQILKELLMWCSQILLTHVSLLKTYWLITNTIPTKEWEWFRLIVGPEKATEFFFQIEENIRTKKSIKELYIETCWKGVNEEEAKNIIKEAEESNPKYFVKKEIKKRMFETSRTGSIVSIRVDSLHNITNNEKIQKLIQEGKYKWIIEYLIDIINPEFSRSYFNVKLSKE